MSVYQFEVTIEYFSFCAQFPILHAIELMVLNIYGLTKSLAAAVKR